MTERKKTEERLGNELSFRDQLLDQAAEGIVVWRLSHTDTFAEFIIWNRRMQEITGFTKEEINRIGWLQAVYADESQRAKARKTMLKVIEGTINHGKHFNAVTKSGARRVLHIASSPISGENSEPCILAIVEDVTERKHQESLLAASNRRFQTLFESSTDGTFILDMHGNFIDINRTAHERLGYTKEEMLGLNVKDIDPPEFAANVPTRMKQLVEKGVTFFESAHYRKDGSIMPVEINARLLELDGEQVVLSMVRDISERKALEAQLRQSQKMESIGTLVGGIAHDFNNMLTAVQGNIYLAKKQVQGHPVATDKLDNIDKLSHRAANTVQQLLTFARKDIVRMHAFSLNAFMEEGYALAQAAVPENVNHKTSICDEPLYTRGDETQLQQVLFNLLSNAVDAVAETENPEIRCSLNTCKADDSFSLRHPELNGKSFACMTVKDNGHGISSEYLDKIFEPFFTTKEVGKGTGLGLAMLYGAIQTHGGVVEVESEPGRGSSFKVYLPLSHEHPASNTIELPVQEKMHGEMILLVDDERGLRETAAEVLIDMGYKVLAASNGVEALELFRLNRQGISLILTDVIMPEMGGLKLLHMIREIDQQVPVILSTGYDKDDVLDQNTIREHCEIIHKPFDFDDMGRIIQSMIR